MGGCANSKYAVDEDVKNKTSGGDVDKKSKKPFLNIKNKLTLKNGTVKKEEGEVAKTANGGVGDESHKNGDVANKEEIEFIDTEKAAATAATTTTVKEEENEDGKKEVTTYQTTVVKHTQKEGDELLQHLRDEAFRTLQNSLKHLNANTTKTTTASAGESGQAQTTVEDGESSSAQQSAEELIAQVKAQVVVALGRVKQDEIGSIVDAGVESIRESRVKSMAELESELEKRFEPELVKKVVNATTGFLTAKGTEAGALLSNILANVSNGIQGVMNETEKTTVKVTRTITEHVLSGGQIKEVTRVITEPMSMSDASNPPPASLTDILKNLTSDKQVKQGSQVTHSSVQESEEHETVTSNMELKEKAEKVVSQAVEAAVEKLADETTDSAGQQQPNGFHHDESIQEEKIKVEEESTVKTSTTKIILNGTDEHLSAVQAEFFKTGKQEAENVVKKLEEAAAAVADEVEEIAAEIGAATEETETKTANTNENTKTELTA